jgi:hypothetical protein
VDVERGRFKPRRSAAISAPVANFILLLERFKSSGAEHPAKGKVNYDLPPDNSLTHLRSSTCVGAHKSRSSTTCTRDT